MATAYSQNLVQFISAFDGDYDNPSIEFLPIGYINFHTTSYWQFAGGRLLTRFDHCDSGMSTPAGSVILPNGSKYDPYQVYNAPQVPGTVDVYFWMLPDHASINAAAVTLNQTETAIMAYYAWISSLIGYRGTLYGWMSSAYNSELGATATARFTGLSTTWGPPKQVPSAYGAGAGQTKGIESLFIKASFDLITNWAWDTYG